MNAKGWCPSLYEPMPAADGLLARIKPPGGILTAEAARRLAYTAATYGNGLIGLTSRGNLQVRGLTPDSHPAFIAAVVEAGLADPNPEIERRRAVIYPPLGTPEAIDLAASIDTMLATDPCLASLPPKFAVAVDIEASADITIVDSTTVTLPNSPLAAHVPDALDAVHRLAPVFLAHPPARRMRNLVAERGAPAIFAAAGLHDLRPIPPARPVPPVGWRDDTLHLGVAFGMMTAADLVAIAIGTLHPTPWRTILISRSPCGRRLGGGDTLPDLPPTVITDPTDPRLGIITCPGLGFCPATTVDLHKDAVLLLNLPLPQPVHLSGCTKGCAHPGPAPITLVGNDGRYDLVRNGRASDPPNARGLTMREAVVALAPLP